MRLDVDEWKQFAQVAFRNMNEPVTEEMVYLLQVCGNEALQTVAKKRPSTSGDKT